MIYGSAFGTLAGDCPARSRLGARRGVDLPLFLLVGILGSAAQLCLIRAFSLAEASVVAPFGYIGILFATHLGNRCFTANIPIAGPLFGALVIVLAGLYVWHRETHAAPRA